jgi:cation transport ATPase
MLHQPRVAELLEAELRKSPGIAVVRANPVTGRLLVYHDTALNGEKVGQLVRETVRQSMTFTRSSRPKPGVALARVQRRHHAGEKCDPRLGRTRQAQLAEIRSGDDGAMVIADDERNLNRYIGAAAVCMGTAIVSFAYPPLFFLTVASAIYAGMRIFKNGYNSLVHERRISLDIIGSLYLVCAFVGGFFSALLSFPW